MRPMTHQKKLKTLKEMKVLLHRFEKKEQWQTLWDLLNGHTFYDPEGVEWLKDRCIKYLSTKYRPQ
jgi:hypothetical protein